MTNTHVTISSNSDWWSPSYEAKVLVHLDNTNPNVMQLVHTIVALIDNFSTILLGSNFDVQQQKAIRAAQEQTFQRNKTNIYEALGLNYNASQRQLDNAYRSAFYDEQNEAIQLAKQIGSASTRGMSGVSASRVDREPLAERGRNIAIRRQNLLEALVTNIKMILRS